MLATAGRWLKAMSISPTREAARAAGVSSLGPAGASVCLRVREIWEPLSLGKSGRGDACERRRDGSKQDHCTDERRLQAADIDIGGRGFHHGVTREKGDSVFDDVTLDKFQIREIVEKWVVYREWRTGNASPPSGTPTGG